MNRMKNRVGFGINVRSYCREHEALVSGRLQNGDRPDELLELHAKKIAWLQHERLVHLIVTALFTVILFAFVGLFLAVTGPVSLALLVIVFILLAFYVRHYFFLENTVQHWYRLYDEIVMKRRERDAQPHDK